MMVLLYTTYRDMYPNNSKAVDIFKKSKSKLKERHLIF